MIGRIYKIIVSCSNEIYIGSTIQECRARWQEHKSHYKLWKNGGKMKKVMVFELFEKWEVENCKIILIKEYEIVDRKHLEMYEQLWINKLKPINKNNSFQIKYLTQKKCHKEWYKKRVQEDPEYEKKQIKKRVEKNPNFYRRKKTCECGLEMNMFSIPKHKKTKIHQERMTQKLTFS